MFFHHFNSGHHHRQPPPLNQSKYYDVLGISPSASEQEIKSAYRRLSLEYHPDRNKSSDAQRRFQEIGEAYETLSDQEKKQEYDQGPDDGFPPELAEMMNMLFSGNRMAGAPIHIIRPQNFIIQSSVPITLEQAYSGTCVPIRTENGETIYITIPPGTDNNETIFSQLSDGRDIRVIIQVQNNSAFERNGLDLHYKKKISLKEALLGTTFEVPHLNGKIFAFSHKNIISPGTKTKIPDLGMIRHNGETMIKGSFVIEFEVIFPESLSQEQIQQLTEIL